MTSSGRRLAGVGFIVLGIVWIVFQSTTSGGSLMVFGVAMIVLGLIAVVRPPNQNRQGQ